MTKPLNLLVFCYEYPPVGAGAGNALANMASIWAKRGHRVTVVTSGFTGLAASEMREGVRVVRIPVGRRDLSRGRLIEMMAYMLGSQRISDRLYHEMVPDLAVAFMTLPSGAAPVHLKQKYGLPLVSELRGGDVPGFLPKLLGLFHFVTRRWIINAWAQSSVVIANSDGLARTARRSAPELSIEVVPNGVDTTVFRPAEMPRRQKDRCHCIFVGRLVDGQKQIGKIIDVVARNTDLELSVVGAGPDERRLRQRAQLSGGHGRIHFCGWLKDGDLVRIYQDADIYVSASVAEGMSNSALEAMACGLPLVLSRIPGHQELVIEEQNGFLFDPGSTSELEGRLLSLAANPHLRDALSACSRKRAEDDFNWDRVADRHLELYHRAVPI